MKIELTKWDFEDAFQKGMYKNNFTFEALGALYDYLEDFGEDTGIQIDFDIVAIACDFTEYENLKELQNDYSDIETIEDLENHTTVIPIYDYKGDKQDNFIIQTY